MGGIADTRRHRRKTLRTVAHGIRAAPASSSQHAADADVLALVETPYSDVADAHDRLVELQRCFEARDDRRAVFLSIYAAMTGAVADRIDHGTFADPDWVERYLVTFANLYRGAVFDYEAGRHDSLSTAWQLAFEAAEHGESLVSQDAMLGVNAHINYDLALALDAVGTRPNRRQKYADHHAVTEVIRALVDDTQDSLAAREADGIAHLDDSLGEFDEWMTVVTIDECRDSAWRTACALRSRLGPRRRLARWLNAVTSAGAARLILASRRSDRVHDALGDLERAEDG